MPVDEILFACEEQMEKSLEHLKHDLRGLRTGRASPALVDGIKVDYYGTPTDLRSIAAISVPEATQLLIKPFNPGDIKAIEKGINDSKIGLTPHSDGKQIRLVLPALSQERRVQLVNQGKQSAEQCKVQVRNARRDANKAIDAAEKAGDISEDTVTSGKDQVQELTKAYETRIDELLENKRKEIMEV